MRLVAILKQKIRTKNRSNELLIITIQRRGTPSNELDVNKERT